MTKPLFILFSLLLTGGVVALVGWQALFAITAMSFLTLLYSSEGPPPDPATVEGEHDDGPMSVDALQATDEYCSEEAIEEAIDDAGWYYPLADKVLALSAANETSFGTLEPGPAQAAFNAAAA